MDLRLQNTLIDSTADPVELQKIATMHQQFISQDIAMSAGIKVSLLSHSWRQQPCLKEIEYDTNDLSNTREWDGKGIADLDSRQVLLEWRPKSHVLDPMEMRRRVTDIVGLLHDTNATKPKTLLVPDCTGYIDRTAYGDEQRCIGVIYNYPETFNTNQPYSLFEVLSPKEIRYHEAPPLEIRQGMARSLALTIYQIHVTGWLHKGIRPHNLIFFDAEEKCPSLIRTQAVSRMRLIGFDYSRPDTRDQKSEETDPAFDLYRHPQAQGSPRERSVYACTFALMFSILMACSFCKAFDLYALGLVLLEIGFWERLGNQLKLYRQKYDNDGQAKLRSHLVHARGPMKQLPFLMGTPYHDAIKLCLNAPLPVPGEEGQESNQTMVEILHNLS